MINQCTAINTVNSRKVRREGLEPIIFMHWTLSRHCYFSKPFVQLVKVELIFFRFFHTPIPLHIHFLRRPLDNISYAYPVTKGLILETQRPFHKLHAYWMIRSPYMSSLLSSLHVLGVLDSAWSFRVVHMYKLGGLHDHPACNSYKTQVTSIYSQLELILYWWWKRQSRAYFTYCYWDQQQWMGTVHSLSGNRVKWAW